MKTTGQILAVPAVLALAAIALVIGHFAPLAMIMLSAVAVAASGYLILRGRRGDGTVLPVSRLLPLLPGHFLVLLGVALVREPGWLPWIWMVIPLLTIVYDAFGRHPGSRRRKAMSILSFLYVILWADLFYVLERIIALRRGMAGSEEIILAVALGVTGGLFIGVGVYRHWLAAKE